MDTLKGDLIGPRASGLPLGKGFERAQLEHSYGIFVAVRGEAAIQLARKHLGIEISLTQLAAFQLAKSVVFASCAGGECKSERFLGGCRILE